MGSLQRSQQLRKKIALAHPSLRSVARTFWTHPKLAKMFPDFLFLVYCVARSTVPLLMTAANCARARAGADPVSPALVDYYAKHAREELHHDEWLLEDMKALGMDRAEILARVPSRNIASLIGTQYYWAFHYHPAALLGYLAVLEGTPPLAEQLNEIQRKNGLPEKAFRTLLKHARLDPHHGDDLDKLLDQLPFTSAQTTLLTFSAFHTIEKTRCAFQEILESHSHHQRN
jgi:heme oxygenase-like protein